MRTDVGPIRVLTVDDHFQRKMRLNARLKKLESQFLPIAEIDSMRIPRQLALANLSPEAVNDLDRAITAQTAGNELADADQRAWLTFNEALAAVGKERHDTIIESP
jgi:hypothetical protein